MPDAGRTAELAPRNNAVLLRGVWLPYEEKIKTLTTRHRLAPGPARHTAIAR